MVTAQIAWDLARQSDGRFMLGLDAHFQRRFGEDASEPVGKMREYVESLRAIQDTFQTNARLRYRGEHYQFRLMAPFFNPGPIAQPDIPLYLEAGDAAICQLAGEIGAGLAAPAFHTPSYLRDVILPAVDAGLKAAGRARNDIDISASVVVISGETDAEGRSAAANLRRRLASCARSPSFGAVMRHHGWGALADALDDMAREQRWATMQDALFR